MILETSISISQRGAILLTPAICVDGHEPTCHTRVVTHIHSDHLLDLEKSILTAKRIIATPITMDLLDILGYTISQHKRIALDYGKTFAVDDSELRLEYAHHIAGTAQVVIESRDFVAAYTSDFKHPRTRTPVIKGVDVLVIDATYGNPRYRRQDENLILENFVKLLYRLLAEKPVHVYAYYGKAQEVMMLLREYGVDTPFIASPRQWRVLNVLSKYGFHVRDVYLDGTADANEIRKSGWYIAFHHHTKFYSLRNVKSVHHVLLSGWLFSTPIRRLNGNSWIVGFSDHADFDELIAYVDEARPRLIIVDGFRGGAAAYRFANHVEKELGIKSLVKP